MPIHWKNTLLVFSFLYTNLLVAQDYIFVREISGYSQKEPLVYLNGPQSVAIDTSGQIYVADYNKWIQKFDSNGRFLQRWSSPVMDNDMSLAIDGAQNVYAAEFHNSVIRKFSPNGKLLKEWGFAENVYLPNDITISKNSFVYVAEPSINRIVKFDTSGNYISHVEGIGNDSTSFEQATSIGVDAEERLYIADYSRGRIVVFDSSFQYVSSFKTIYRPYHVKLDAKGHVFTYSSSGIVIEKYDTSGILLGTVSRPMNLPSSLDFGNDFTITESGNIFILDNSNGLLKINSNLQFQDRNIHTDTFALGQMIKPYSVATDDAGHVYVTQYEHKQVQKYDTLGRALQKWELNFAPNKIALDGNKYVYLSDNQRVYKYDTSGHLLDTLSKPGSDFSDLNSPRSLAVDDQSNVYVGTSDYATRVYNDQGEFLGALLGPGGVGESPSALDVQDGFVYYISGQYAGAYDFAKSRSIEYLAGRSHFNFPADIKVDSYGHVLLGDYATIYTIEKDGNILNTWGQFGTDSTMFAFITGMSVNNNGDLFISDFNNNRVLMFRPTQKPIVLRTSSESATSPLFSVYPNPSTGYFNVDTDESSHYEVQVRDMQGNVLFEQPNAKTVSIENWPKGIVFVTIKTIQTSFHAKMLVR